MEPFPFSTRYGGTTSYATIVENKYANNQAIQLEVHDALNGETICVATTNIPGYRPEPGYVLIKNWSENDGVYDALLNARIIGPVEQEIPAGFATAYLCKYLLSGE